MFRLDGKIALVTGGASGIGAVTAHWLQNAGATVAVLDANEASTERMTQKYPGIIASVCDATDIAAVNKTVSELMHSVGPIDILVNNVGGEPHPQAITELIEELDGDDFDFAYKINLKSTFNCCRAVVSSMRTRHYGRIVNVSSGAGRTWYGRHHGLFYATAKAGLLGFTRQLSRELAPFGINVNSVAPGATQSENKTSWIAMTSDDRQRYLDQIPLKRLGELDEVAAAITFLATEEASYLVGICIDVVGGRYMY